LLKKFKIVLSIVTVCLAGCSETEQQCTLVDSEMSLSDVYQMAVERGFTGSVLVRHKGEVLLDEAAGFAKLEPETPNTTDTIFDIGSITKQMTAALVLNLQEAGLLSVEDTLADYFDEVPESKEAITINQLLTHSAGFPLVLIADAGDEPETREDYIELALNDTALRFIPGDGFLYSHAGHTLVAIIVEKVTGQTFEEALNERILMPAGLNNTGYTIPDWSDAVFADGFAGTKDIDLDATRLAWAEQGGPNFILRGIETLLGNTGDLLQWHDAINAQSVLNASSTELFEKEQFRTGLGGSMYTYGGYKVDTPAGALFWHDGSNARYYSTLRRFVDEDLVIVMLANKINQASFCLPNELAKASSADLLNWTVPLRRN